MKIPSPKTVAYAIARHIHEHGAATDAACVEALPSFTARSICTALRAMADDGLLTLSGTLYALDPRLADYFDLAEEAAPEAKAQITPPPYRPEPRPWTGKYNISAVARRHDAAPPRDARFHYGDTSEDPLQRAK
jgi:hypothetical protein